MHLPSCATRTKSETETEWQRERDNHTPSKTTDGGNIHGGEEQPQEKMNFLSSVFAAKTHMRIAIFAQAHQLGLRFDRNVFLCPDLSVRVRIRTAHHCTCRK